MDLRHGIDEIISNTLMILSMILNKLTTIMSSNLIKLYKFTIKTHLFNHQEIQIQVL